MESSLKLLRTVWLALLASIVLYVALGEGLRVSQSAIGPFYYSMLALGVVMVGAIFAVRRTLLSRSESALAISPDDRVARLLWLNAHIVMFAMCEAVALLGFVSRFMGASLAQAAPFYLAGLLLLLYFAPRPPANTIG